MVLVGSVIFHFCDPTSLGKVVKMPPKGFVVQNKSATLRFQCLNSNSRGNTWLVNTRESTMLNVVVERWLGMLYTWRRLPDKAVYAAGLVRRHQSQDKTMPVGAELTTLATKLGLEERRIIKEWFVNAPHAVVEDRPCDR
eukprot:SAG31_NODE_68_length_28153_cov_23.647717_18_plen_140_part_00